MQERTTLPRTLEERVGGLEARLAEQVTHVQSLEQKHHQAREALEHFRHAAKEQRDAESRRYEHQVQQLQVELRQANELVTTKNHEAMQLNRDNARLTELHGQSENALRMLRREHEQLSLVAKETAALKRENDTLGQQRVQVTYERDQLRAELEERRRSDTRLQAIEERLTQLKPQDSTVTASRPLEEQNDERSR